MVSFWFYAQLFLFVSFPTGVRTGRFRNLHLLNHGIFWQKEIKVLTSPHTASPSRTHFTCTSSSIASVAKWLMRSPCKRKVPCSIHGGGIAVQCSACHGLPTASTHASSSIFTFKVVRIIVSVFALAVKAGTRLLSCAHFKVFFTFAFLLGNKKK